LLYAQFLYYTGSVTIKVIKRGEWVSMDYTNRGTQASTAQAPAPDVPTSPAPARRSHGTSSNTDKKNSKWFRAAIVAAFAVVIILVIAVIFTISTAGNDNEGKYVDTSKLQAVFLNTGQVYFGNIKTLNDKYFVLTNIYYLQTSGSSSTTTTTSSNSNVSLVKLGCELHMPYDQMVINRDEVTFWENLQSTGQVAKAVASFQKANPDGQKCSDQSSSASTTSGTSTQGATSSTGTTGTTSTNP
jgi:hypothetical protein